MTHELQGYQKRRLKAMAHDLKAAVLVGQKGVTSQIVQAIDEALDAHELIKIKFIDVSEKSVKKELIDEIKEQTACFFVGMTGHVAILFRERQDPEKRKIVLPERKT
ncbi:MAG: YhbY family RNA-binding protein [Syntrophales bacterium]|jgi:RNA-binding protein|nr:YhbY family RNA-binding protein [Syntrophales bacterium]MDY0044239.1 YhbY family RNA-binding protein [Syntrophales bacterium]